MKMMIRILIAIVLLSVLITELYAQTITSLVAAGPAEDIAIIDSETTQNNVKECIYDYIIVSAQYGYSCNSYGKIN
jgi:hypothetical protein